MDLTTSSPHLLVFRDTRDQLMWLDRPCSGFDIVVVDSVVVLHAHCKLVHDFSTEVGKVATVSKFQNMDLSRRRNGANFTLYSNESV